METNKLGEGGKEDQKDIYADRIRGGEEDTNMVVDYIDGGEVGMCRDD